MLISVWNYLRPLWEGDDNKPSIRRIFAIAFLVGTIRMIELSYRSNYELKNDILTTLCGTILILLGIVTMQNIIKYKNSDDNSKAG